MRFIASSESHTCRLIYPPDHSTTTENIYQTNPAHQFKSSPPRNPSLARAPSVLKTSAPPSHLDAPVLHAPDDLCGELGVSVGIQQKGVERGQRPSGAETLGVAWQRSVTSRYGGAGQNECEAMKSRHGD